MQSTDLMHRDPPLIIKPEGCTAKWSKEARQIDPYLVYYNQQFWCFYKSGGKLGLLQSSDLESWTEGSSRLSSFGSKTNP